MGLNVYVDSLPGGKKTSTGLQTVNDPPGFTPTLYGIVPTRLTTAGWLDGHSFAGLGMATASAQRAHSMLLRDAVSAGATARRSAKEDRVFTTARLNTNAIDSEAAHSTMDVSGYTINWTAMQTLSAWLTPYFALGGSDITNAALVSWITPTSAGLYTPTLTPTISFTPTLAIHFTIGRAGSPGVGGGGGFGLGVMDDTGAQWGGMMGKASEANPSDSVRCFRDDNCYFMHSPSGNVSVRALYDAMLSNGFRVNFTHVPGTEQQLVFSLLMAGTFRKKIFTFEKDASPDNQNSIALGHPGKFLMLASAMAPRNVPANVNDGIMTNNLGMIGLSDGMRHRVVGWTEQNGVATSNIRQFYSAAAAALVANNTSGTTEALGVPSYSGDDLLIDWSPNDTQQIHFGGLSLTDSASGSAHDRPLTETAGLSDSITQVSSIQRTITPN